MKIQRKGTMAIEVIHKMEDSQWMCKEMLNLTDNQEEKKIILKQWNVMFYWSEMQKLEIG